MPGPRDPQHRGGCAPARIDAGGQRLHRDARGVFSAAKDMAAGGAPRTGTLRLAAEREPDDALDRCRGCGKEDAERIVAMLDRDKRPLFAFVEHDGVEPTNNRPRAFRYVVLPRKIFGQIKGGRLSWISRRTWHRAQGLGGPKASRQWRRSAGSCSGCGGGRRAPFPTAPISARFFALPPHRPAPPPAPPPPTSSSSSCPRRPRPRRALP